MDIYVIQTDVRLKFFATDPQTNEPDLNVPLLSRHPMNNRAHAAVREQYVRSILETGNIIGVRGVPWVLQAHGSTGGTDSAYQLMSYATLTESVYESVRREPNNKFVLETIRGGLPGSTVFHPRTPPDVLRYLKDIHNAFHQGVASLDAPERCVLRFGPLVLNSERRRTQSMLQNAKRGVLVFSQGRILVPRDILAHSRD
eukprot:3199543-Lingulodinium_polyedra.AAC.1